MIETSPHWTVVIGSLCLLAALLEAWLLVVVFSSETSPLSRVFPGRQDLLKSHIDYLMMAQFLFVLFLLMQHFKIGPPAWVVAALCIGSFFNPFAFFVRAMRPHYKTDAPVPFKLMISLSCILTTLGYGWVAVAAASAALAR